MTDPATPPAGGPDTSVALMNGEGGFVENWADLLGEDFKDDAPTLNRYKSPMELGKAHMELRRKSSMDPHRIVEIPSEDSPDEVKAAFYKARGKPDSVEGYAYELAKELKEKVEVDGERLEKFKKLAFDKLHLSPTEFKEAMDFYFNDISESIDKYDLILEERRNQEHDEGMATLKKILGNALDERTLRANAVLRKFGEKPVKMADGTEVNPLEKLFEEAPQLKNSPWMTLILDNIASSFSEDTIKGLSAPVTPTPADLDRKIGELRNHPAFNNRSHPEHKALQNQIQELYKKRYPD